MKEAAPPLARTRRERRGILALSVYRRLHEAAARAGGGTFVEIGSAYGAATVALALGARSGGQPFRLYTADVFDEEIAPRWRGMTGADGVAQLCAGLHDFGVQEDVTVVRGTTADLLTAHDLSNINLLLIDADGRIDRDLGLLLDRLSPGAAIIIDDADGGVYLETSSRPPTVDLNHRLTRLLLEAYAEHDILHVREMVGQTAICALGFSRPDAAEWQRIFHRAYANLVRSELSSGQWGMKASLRRLLARRAPNLLASWSRCGDR